MKPLRHAPAITLILITALLFGCSNRPDDAAIESMVRAEIAEFAPPGIFVISGYRKLNGIPRNENTYIAEVEYQLNFLVDLEDAATTLSRGGQGLLGASMGTALLGVKYGNFRSGESRSYTQRYRFIRSEKGWLLDQEK